jgi:hypothetical protein
MFPSPARWPLFINEASLPAQQAQRDEHPIVTNSSRTLVTARRVTRTTTRPLPGVVDYQDPGRPDPVPRPLRVIQTLLGNPYRNPYQMHGMQVGTRGLRSHPDGGLDRQRITSGKRLGAKTASRVRIPASLHVLRPYNDTNSLETPRSVLCDFFVACIPSAKLFFLWRI